MLTLRDVSIFTAPPIVPGATSTVHLYLHVPTRAVVEHGIYVQKSAKENVHTTKFEQRELTCFHPLEMNQGVAVPALPAVL